MLRALWPVVLVLLVAYTALCDPLDDRVSALLRDVEYLDSRGVDVSNITKSLDAAIRLYDANRTSETMGMLDSISSEVDALKSQAEGIYLRRTVARYGVAALALSLPLIAYLAVPRAYLYLWFRLRRGWLVRKRRGGGK
ncbi:hypothetical protein IG193_02195 [Infirmifilum lucidum]|uniref:DUF2937 family protein n=1 Tax=Infirmifilum lucidum TaxID=2776706 RepID=A0A7L9FK93_9CREN|nr:hypothetical protein [Infirmifilum lucidum]QOJ79296.1 hypothetical protein IG193_02195 [Infirmifilum lucidum]